MYYIKFICMHFPHESQWLRTNTFGFHINTQGPKKRYSDWICYGPPIHTRAVSRFKTNKKNNFLIYRIIHILVFPIVLDFAKQFSPAPYQRGPQKSKCLIFYKSAISIQFKHTVILASVIFISIALSTNIDVSEYRK